MHAFLTSLRADLREAARSATLGVLGTVLVLVGLAFLTVALWLYLVTVGSALLAALIIGALYCAVGFILLALASSRGRARAEAERLAAAAPPPPDTRAPFVQLAEGFAIGMQAGRSARR